MTSLWKGVNEEFQQNNNRSKLHQMMKSFLFAMLVTVAELVRFFT